MMSLWDALRMNMMISYQELVRTFPKLMYDHYATALNLKEISVDFNLPSVQLFLMYNRASLNNKAFAAYINQISSEGL